jgi:hypothetical protein
MREAPADSTSKTQAKAGAAPESQWGPVLLFALVLSISRHTLEIWVVDHFAMGISVLIASLVYFPFRTTRKEYTLTRWMGFALLLAAIGTLVFYLIGLAFE